ncbi:conserved hypothetical protein [Arthrobacter sp. Hiyo8]|uniref:ERF family protein n=1 Tax=Arthrobacter sp. Hiyo1 TaxID=1588020 RepID=UPI000683918E|nr:ERF family protein [Arthrobacter sp. Hiyo1]BAS17596.1 conserved hypothetical protein [Arthrobacter sp. Hiyo8]GAP57956.1 conserved hypothetical protein [Arthrobacter sp. Hiyo1]
MGEPVAKSEPESFASLNLYQKLARITGEVGAIKKGGTNREQGYGFIEYAAVAGELRGLFAKYGVVIVPRMQQGIKQSRSQVTSARGAVGNYLLVDMYFTVTNADNPEDKFTVSWTGEALDYGDKATNKAATSALKYYLMRQFNISEKGEDADEHTPEPAVTRVPEDSAPKASATKAASDKQKGLIASLALEAGKDNAWIDNVMQKTRTSADASAVIDQLQALKDKDGINQERVWK